MFRILVTFENHESLLLSTKHFVSLDQIEQRLSDPLPWVIQTENGPITIDNPDVDLVVIQRMSGNRILEHRTLIFKKGDIMAEEEKTVIIPEVVDNSPEEQTKALVTPAYIKFVSFREKFLKQSAESASWEDLIVEKQADYNKHLKEIHGELATRDADAKALKEKITGK